MKHIAVQVSTQGPTILVAGQPNYSIYVYAFSLSALPLDDTVPVFSLLKFQSINPATGLAQDLTGFRALNQYGLSWDFPMSTIRLTRPDAYLVTNAGDSLALFQADAFDLGGFVCYEQSLA